MGHWTMVIEGVGPHDNTEKYDADADKLLKEFVDKLKEKSQWVYHASFTAGSRKIADGLGLAVYDGKLN